MSRSIGQPLRREGGSFRYTSGSRFSRDDLIFNWTVPGNILPIEAINVAKPAAIALSVTVPTPTATGTGLIVTAATPHASWVSTTSSISFDAQLGVAFAPGDLLVACYAGDNAFGGGASLNFAGVDGFGFGSGIAVQGFGSGGTYDPGAINTGIEGGVYVRTCTIARAATDVVTVQFSTASVAKCVVFWKVSALPGKYLLWSLAGSDLGSTTGTPSITTDPVPVGRVTIAAIAAETNATITPDDDTTNGTWSAQLTTVADTGTLLTSARVASQAKEQTATTSTQTYNPTMASVDSFRYWVVIDFAALPQNSRPKIINQAIARAAVR